MARASSGCLTGARNLLFARLFCLSPGVSKGRAGAQMTCVTFFYIPYRHLWGILTTGSFLSCIAPSILSVYVKEWKFANTYNPRSACRRSRSSESAQCPGAAPAPPSLATTSALFALLILFPEVCPSHSHSLVLWATSSSLMASN